MSTSVELPDEVAASLRAEADRRGVPVPRLLVELLAGSAGQAENKRSRFAFIGAGDSGESGGDIAASHDAIRREAFGAAESSEA
jgi:hypothetical protein